MSTDNAGLVTEEIVRQACDAHDAWMADKYGEGEAVAGAMHVALETALSAVWRPIEPSPLDASAPPRVFLQVDTDGDDEDRGEPIPRECWGDMTWHHERIGGQEIEYVRVDRPWSAPKQMEGA